MLVDRTRANGAATWHGNFCFMKSSKQDTEQIIGCADLADVVKIDLMGMNTCADDTDLVTIDPFHLRTDPGDRVKQYINVTDIRQVVDNDRFFG